MTTYFSETFTASAPTFGGDQTWVQVAGVWSNEGGNKATVTLGGSSAVARIASAAPGPDMVSTITARTVGSGRSLGLAARSNATTTFAALTAYVADFHFDASTCYLFKVIAGTSTAIASISITPPSFPATLSLSVYGTDLRVYINGSQVGTTQTDSSIATGNYGGLWVFNSSNDVEFSNYVVGSALQSTGIVNGAATLGQSSTVSATPTYGAVASATLSQSTSLAAQTGYTAVPSQTQSLTLTGRYVAVSAPSLQTSTTLSAFGFTYWFAESFRVFDGTTFGGDITWTSLGQSWVNSAVREGTCNAHGVTDAIIANRDAPGADMSVRLTIDGLTSDRSVGVVARANSAATSLADLNGYVLDVHGDNGGQYYLLAVVDGNVTVLAGPVLMPVVAGDVITLSIMGTGLTLLQNGFTVGTYTDSSITTGTRAGIWSYNGNGDVAFSNFAVTSAFNQVVVYPTGIPSGLAIGTLTAASGNVTVIPNGLISGAIIGQPVLTTTIGVSPTGIASVADEGSPALTSTVTVVPTGIASTLAFGGPTLSITINVAPTGIPSVAALGSPEIAASLVVSPTGIATSAALGTPAIAPGPAPVGPAGISSQLAEGAPTLTSTLPVHPTGIASGAVMGNPGLTSTVTVTPTGLGANETVGSPSISAITGVRGIGIFSNLAIGLPSLRRRDYKSPNGIPSTSGVGSPKVTSSVTVFPTGIASTAAYGAPSTKRVFVLLPQGITSGVTFGTPTVTSTLGVTPQGILPEETFGKPTAAPGPATALPGGISSQAAVGTPTVTRVLTPNPPRDRIRRMAAVHRIMDE